MNSIKHLFLFIVSVLLITNLNAQSDKELKVLSWNVYMLPGITNLSKQIKKSDKRGRAEEIAAYLNESEYDIVVFQEAFFNPSRKILSKDLIKNYPYQYGPVNPSGISLKTSSGIFIVSKIPLKELGTVQYETCNGVDCFAKKGAGLFEGEFNGKPFQILGTHLNAGGPSWIREAQFDMMKTLLDDYKKLGVPQIVCGDMNTHKEEAEKYNFMIDALSVIDAPTQSAQKNTTAKNRSVIDYIFFRSNNTSFKTTDKKVHWIKSDKKRVKKLFGNLSDHLAVSASFKWE